MRILTGFSTFFLLLGQSLAGAQDSIPAQVVGSYRVDVRLVQVDAQVVNKKTGEVSGSLKKEDLLVYEDFLLFRWDDHALPENLCNRQTGL